MNNQAATMMLRTVKLAALTILESVINVTVVIMEKGAFSIAAFSTNVRPIFFRQMVLYLL
jgi:hypothetical protein